MNEQRLQLLALRIAAATAKCAEIEGDLALIGQGQNLPANVERQRKAAELVTRQLRYALDGLGEVTREERPDLAASHDLFAKLR